MGNIRGLNVYLRTLFRFLTCVTLLAEHAESFAARQKVHQILKCQRTPVKTSPLFADPTSQDEEPSFFIRKALFVGE